MGAWSRYQCALLLPRSRKLCLGVICAMLVVGACGGSSVKLGDDASRGGVAGEGARAGAGGDRTGSSGTAGIAGSTTIVAGGSAGATVGGEAGTGTPVAGTGGRGASGRAGTSGTAGETPVGGAGGAPDPGCRPEDVESCNPGPNQVCTTDECRDGVPTPSGVLERGDGVVCKFFPDEVSPDFACMEGEWCQYESRSCRCGRHPGCQRGERCTSCEGEACSGDPNEYLCTREVACTEDNLTRCAAGAGQVCAAGALACTAAPRCSVPGAGATAIACGDASNGLCCPANHWCFDGRECRCGSGPACADDSRCELDGIGFFTCRTP